MSFTGGDLIEIAYSHPTLGTGRWEPKAGEDAEQDPGGRRTEDDDGMITGQGTMIKKISRVRWSLTAPTMGWAKDPDTLKELADLAADPNDADFTFTYLDGSVYAGKGTVVGDVKGNKVSAMTNAIKFEGGILESIAKIHTRH